MNWSIKAMGERSAVRSAVMNTPDMPKGLRRVVVKMLENGAAARHHGARVAASGSSEEDGATVVKLEVELCPLLRA